MRGKVFFGNHAERTTCLSAEHGFHCRVSAWQAVERAVSEELSVWPVHEKARVTYGEVHDMLSRIRRRIEGPRTPATAVGTQPTSFPLLHYVIGTQHGRTGRVKAGLVLLLGSESN